MDLKGNLMACFFFFPVTKSGRAGDNFKWHRSASWHLVTTKLNINCETLQSTLTCMRTAGIATFFLCHIHFYPIKSSRSPQHVSIKLPP